MPSTEPVQSQQTPSASETRPPGVEGVKPEGDAHADGQVLDTQANPTSSKASGLTSAEQQEGSAYYSWWNYVGWGSDGTTGQQDKVVRGGSLEAGGLGEFLFVFPFSRSFHLLRLSMETGDTPFFCCYN